jgi:hypothetical protein
MVQNSKQKFITFKNKFIDFLKRNESILTSMFLYGLLKKGYFYIRDLPEFTKEFVDLRPIQDSIKKQIDTSQLLKVENGEDENGNSDLDNISPGKLELEYILKRALRFARPEYCMFFIVGLIRGSFNARLINKDEFLELLQILPPQFILSYGEELTKISNHFDETNCEIQLSNDRKKLVAK